MMMTPVKLSTKKSYRKNSRFECCEFCGFRIIALENKGLQISHIVSKTDGGDDSEDNVLFLCNNCAETLDRFIKIKIYKAFKHFNSKQLNGKGFSVPDRWKEGEGRLAIKDKL